LAEETDESYYSQDDNERHDNHDDTNYHQEESVNDNDRRPPLVRQDIRHVSQHGKTREMTQLAVFIAGVLILAASIGLAAIGSLKRAEELRVIDKAGVNLGNTYDANEVRIPFAVRIDSLGIFEIKTYSGRVQIELKRMPISSPPEAKVSGAFPALYSEVSKEKNRFEHQLEPGTYVLALINNHSGDSGVEINLTLRYKVESYPKLYDVGIQMLIVAVPLIVAGILS